MVRLQRNPAHEGLADRRVVWPADFDLVVLGAVGELVLGPVDLRVDLLVAWELNSNLVKERHEAVKVAISRQQLVLRHSVFEFSFEGEGPVACLLLAPMVHLQEQLQVALDLRLLSSGQQALLEAQ